MQGFIINHCNASLGFAFANYMINSCRRFLRNAEAARVDFDLGVNVPEKQRLAKEEVENLKLWYKDIDVESVWL